MKRRNLILTLVLLTAVLVASAAAVSQRPRRVQAADASLSAASQPERFVAGNYCVSCHLADDPNLASVTAWSGSIDREVNSPCPAATKAREELYYTERLLLMIDRAENEAGPLPDSSQARLDSYTQRYSRLLDVPVTSLDAFVNEAQTTRFQLAKVVTLLNDRIEASKVRNVLIYAAVTTLLILGSLAWGLYHTRAIRAGAVGKSRAAVWQALFVMAVLGFFALPIFRVPAVEVAMTTVEQQEAQTILDTAQRAADAADRAQARAWMLARIAATWSKSDTAQAQSLLGEALAALETARENEEALWGQSLVVQEATVGTQIEMESAGLIAGDLNAARARAWAVPLIATEWNSLDAEKAVALLQQEQEAVQGLSGLYRDLQLRSLALAWASVDAARSAPAAGLIDDPALRAWTWRELAVLNGDASLYPRAAESARLIQDPVQRAAALRKIASLSGETALYAEALASLENVTGLSLAYALSDLAAVSGNGALIDQIDPAYPEARASGLLHLGQYQAAWEAASHIADLYELAQAQAAIASAWENAEAAGQIGVTLYRDLALRNIIQKSGSADWVDSIASPYYKVQALVATGDLEAAQALAGELSEPYPLVALAVTLAGTDPQAALTLVDQMSREADKAAALQAIAAASQSYFEQAQGMALASRVRGDALAPAQASLDLASAVWDTSLADALSALRQAYDTAARIAIK